MEEFRPKRVVFDSISTYGSSLGTTGRVFRDFFHALVALMKEHQTATVYNHENPEMLGMSSMMGEFAMSSLVDNIILMNWVEIGDAFRLGLTVAKMRANPTTRTTHECEIINGQGLARVAARLAGRVVSGAVLRIPGPDLAIADPPARGRVPRLEAKSIGSAWDTGPRISSRSPSGSRPWKSTAR